MFFKVLNLFLLGLALTSCGDTIQIQERAESSTNADSGGWSSSGGGEFVGNRNNPWFMGNQVVRWCINHGGSKNFSLSKNDAKIAIEKVLSNFSTQLKSEKYFRLKAGAAIRTSYDELRKRAKGYIYIAADKGRYSYRGLKQNEMFWSHHKDASKNIAHAFDLVVAHELGHVLGFKHSSGDERKLMHADYPASVIQGKFHSEMSRYGFNSQIGIFSSGLFNITKKPLTLSYLMPAVASLEDDSFTNLEYFFVFDINPRHSLLDRYSESDNPYDLNQEHRLRIVSFSKKDQRYQTIESYPIKKLHIDMRMFLCRFQGLKIAKEGNSQSNQRSVS